MPEDRCGGLYLVGAHVCRRLLLIFVLLIFLVLVLLLLFLLCFIVLTADMQKLLDFQYISRT